ncbi:alpha/beta hydrolase [Arenibacter sp. GZD96]|uniref:hypothetical protein n=1 Tax=Aurantibrevibacter litoralis TaxID=3106030 RepID=UPI002AFF0727|nr:hypothetical protein [Arenibacter sp. GZD-96]MEA1787029.1 alpha/beta hydrolase [Arenibacter sp. GZD-96]
MKKFILFFLVLVLHLPFLVAQTKVLKKGTILDSLPISNANDESYALYLPTYFETTKAWPVLFAFNMEGKGKMELRIFQEAAEKQGFVLAASNSLSDTLSLSENILIANRMFNDVFALLPIHKGRVYTGGVRSGANFAAFVPLFIKEVHGVVSWGGTISNPELLSSKNLYFFVGLTDKQSFKYSEMLATEELLNRLKFPNALLVADDPGAIARKDYIERGMVFLTLSAMSKGVTDRDEEFIRNAYEQSVNLINLAIGNIKLIEAEKLMENTIKVFRPLVDTDSLKKVQRNIKREKLYKSQKRYADNLLLKELLTKQDLTFALEEDIITYNYNNLGWWKFQMEELDTKYIKNAKLADQQLGHRLTGFVNALVEDNIDIQKDAKQIDEQALEFLWMLKTIIAPTDYGYYKKIISNSAKNGDYGTALFYVEELLKAGYTNRQELYDLEHTALLRITPEFNTLVSKYLKEARYQSIEE